MTNLAALYQLTQRSAQVEPNQRLALQSNPHFHPARLLLAQWIEAQGQTDQGIALLRKNAACYSKQASLHHALGLALVRHGQRQEALKALRLAYALAPKNADYAYVLAVALLYAGQVEKALVLLRKQRVQATANRNIRMALIGCLRTVLSSSPVHLLPSWLL